MAGIILLMQPQPYDLITLEPPPIAYAGVAALYSEGVLRAGAGAVNRRASSASGCRPQLPTETALAMIRAFVEVFPQAVLIRVPKRTLC